MSQSGYYLRCEAALQIQICLFMKQLGNVLAFKATVSKCSIFFKLLFTITRQTKAGFPPRKASQSFSSLIAACFTKTLSVADLISHEVKLPPTLAQPSFMHSMGRALFIAACEWDVKFWKRGSFFSPEFNCQTAAHNPRLKIHRRIHDCQIFTAGTEETSELQGFHGSDYDAHNGVQPFCFDRSHQSSAVVHANPLKRRLLQTLNYWVPPAVHLSRQTNSFKSLCAAHFPTKTKPSGGEKLQVYANWQFSK